MHRFKPRSRVSTYVPKYPLAPARRHSKQRHNCSKVNKPRVRVARAASSSGSYRASPYAAKSRHAPWSLGLPRRVFTCSEAKFCQELSVSSQVDDDACRTQRLSDTERPRGAHIRKKPYLLWSLSRRFTLVATLIDPGKGEASRPPRLTASATNLISSSP